MLHMLYANPARCFSAESSNQYLLIFCPGSTVCFVCRPVSGLIMWKKRREHLKENTFCTCDESVPLKLFHRRASESLQHF